MKKIRTSFFERAPKLIKSAIKLGQKSNIETLVKDLSELKGMPQKLGQLISMDFSEYLPNEYREKFSILQNSSVEIELDQIIEVLRNNLTYDNFNNIKNLSPRPIGSGSIGQVHVAEIDNKKVALKIKYPNIEKTLSTDLNLLIPIAKTYELFRPKSKDLTILLDEARNMLIQEMNYSEEAKFINYFRSNLSHDSRFYVPLVFENYSNPNIICMEFIEGVSLKDFLSSETEHGNKKRIASSLLELFIDEFFKFGMVQTDPNFANYLITKEYQIILLDFGATKSYEKNFRDLYFKMLQASYHKNHHQIIMCGERLGLVNHQDSPEAVKLFGDFMIDVMSYFRPENNPMNFANEEITKRLLDSGFMLWKKQRITSPDKNLVFLHRKLGGLFSLLKESKVQIDLTLMWEKILARQN